MGWQLFSCESRNKRLRPYEFVASYLHEHYHQGTCIWQEVQSLGTPERSLQSVSGSGSHSQQWEARMDGHHTLFVACIQAPKSQTSALEEVRAKKQCVPPSKAMLLHGKHQAENGHCKFQSTYERKTYIVNCRQHNLVKICILTTSAEPKVAFRTSVR